MAYMVSGNMDSGATEFQIEAAISKIFASVRYQTTQHKSWLILTSMTDKQLCFCFLFRLHKLIFWRILHMYLSQLVERATDGYITMIFYSFCFCDRKQHGQSPTSVSRLWAAWVS